MILGYDAYAADLEHELQKAYPKLRWKVLRESDMGNEIAAILSHSSDPKFEIRCEVPELEWHRRTELSVENWLSAEVYRNWLLESIARGLMLSLIEDLLGNAG